MPNQSPIPQEMAEDCSDFLIKSAALLAKDLLAERTVLSFQRKIEADVDDDLDVYFYSQFIKKRKPQEKTNANISKSRDKSGHTSNNKLFFKFLQECDDISFENQFKMTRKTFQSLVRLLTPNIELENKRQSTGLSTTNLILIALWLLTSPESVKSTADRFNVPEYVCRQAFCRLRDTISLNKAFFISWPNKDRAKKITEEFNEYLVYENRLPNICGVIGCIDISIPFFPEKELREKSTRLFKLQCVCDAKGEFLDSYVAKEFISNVSVFNQSIKQKIESGDLYVEPNSHLIGDKSYPIKKYLMVPFKEFRKTSEQNQFNAHLELSRKIIDIAFKRLLERFQKIKSLEMVEPQSYIEMCCAIHNYCIQQCDTFYLDIGEDDTTITNSKNTCHDFAIDQRALDKRKAIADKFSQ